MDLTDVIFISRAPRILKALKYLSKVWPKTLYNKMKLDKTYVP